MVPGLDGFTMTYYKKQAPLLAPKMFLLFNHALKFRNFTPEMLIVNMCLLLITDRGSIHNCMTPKLHDFGATLITGWNWLLLPSFLQIRLKFILSQQITDNIRLTENVFQDANLLSCFVLLLSLNIQKAFYSVTLLN